MPHPARRVGSPGAPGGFLPAWHPGATPGSRHRSLTNGAREVVTSCSGTVRMPLMLTTPSATDTAPRQRRRPVSSPMRTPGPRSRLEDPTSTVRHTVDQQFDPRRGRARLATPTATSPTPAEAGGALEPDRACASLAPPAAGNGGYATAGGREAARDLLVGARRGACGAAAGRPARPSDRGKA